MTICLQLAIVPLNGACNNWQERLNFPFFSATFSFFIFPLLFFAPTLISFPPALSSCLPSQLSLLTHTFPPHSCYLPIIHLKMSMHTVIYPCCWPLCNVLSFSSFFHFISFLPCETTESTTPPPSLSNCMCTFSLHTLLHSFFCFSPSCRHILPPGAPSLPPTPPPLVLSQLGCGLDGSGPPLPSPRLQQQHQPQIQVIQQL